MDSLGVEAQAPREYCFSVFVEAKKVMGARFRDDKGIEVYEPLDGAIRLLSSAARHTYRPSALPDSNLDATKHMGLLWRSSIAFH
jgi:hypothetical protein